MTQETQLKTEITEEFVGALPGSRRLQFLKTVLIVLIALVLGVLATVLWPKIVFSPHTNATFAVAKAVPTIQVTIDQHGFTPSSTQIHVGATVTWSNNGPDNHQVTANPYPSGSSLPSLNSGQLSSGQTYKYKFTKAGTYSYHDQLNPLLSGTIVVQ